MTGYVYTPPLNHGDSNGIYTGPTLIADLAAPFPVTTTTTIKVPTSGTEWTWIDSRTGNPLSVESEEDEENSEVEDFLTQVLRWISGLGECPPELEKLLTKFKDEINHQNPVVRQKALAKAVAQNLLWVLGELDEEDKQK